MLTGEQVGRYTFFKKIFKAVFRPIKKVFQGIGSLFAPEQPKLPPPPKVAAPPPNLPQFKTELGVKAPSGISSAFQGYSPIQTRTGLATQGIGGAGLGGDEQKYYLSLLRESLEGGDQNIRPVEQEYLTRLGLQGQDPVAILKALQGRA